ncbi:NAD-dependent succinate-semialdehyde dehydrogenase [Gulosibacter hominis]|uniref:NAD-dependent succinate-semialdehyde dehydrogenase n=1 Tax=Gulosibacter hominis TaxID=2770504 RepID=UPI0019192680|nr:NAD-dependent succinate-semialdehyde dehydrogenase [Gulosibacter hominis]
MSAKYRTENPATGQLVKEVPFASDAEINGALERAANAASEWRATPVEERAAIVQRVSELFTAKRDELARIIATEMGKPLGESYGEVDFSADIFRYFAEEGPGQLVDQVLSETDTARSVVQRRPLGTILGVMPWNYPYYQVARFAAPNLVAGNTVLLKHAEICAESASAIAAIMREAGVPEGVYENLFATHEQISTVIADDRVAGVSLTGSERAGAIIAQQAGQALKKVVLELGGSDPFVVLSHDDIPALARDAAAIRFENTGQACNSNKRMIVMADVYDEFVAEMVKLTGELQPIDPLENTEGGGFSPLSSEAAANGLLSQLEDATANGARLLVGGERLDRDGFWVSPAVLVDVTPAARAYREELFGPVAMIFRVESEAEALALANDTPYGLGASVYSTDVAQAERFGEQLEAGMVGVNSQAPEVSEMPFGGVKRSGYGRELGPLGIDEFVNKRLFHVVK